MKLSFSKRETRSTNIKITFIAMENIPALQNKTIVADELFTLGDMRKKIQFVVVPIGFLLFFDAIKTQIIFALFTIINHP